MNSSGKRYDAERKLNVKKIIGTIIAFAVIVMVIISIKKLLEPKETQNPILGYYSAYENNKWGVINNLGEQVITFKYDEMIVIPDNTKDVFIVMENVNYEEETYNSKLINKKEEVLFNGYEQIEAIDNYDENYNIWYEKNVLKVKKDGKYGLINFTGSEILKCEYDNIYSLKGTTNSLILEKDGKIGLASNVGDVIVKPEYKEVKALGDDYSYGYIVVNDENKYGIIDCSKKQVLDVIYDEVTNVFSNNLYTVKVDENLKIIDGNQADVVDLGKEYSEVLQISGDSIVVKKLDKVGVINKSKEVKIPFEYTELKCIFDKYYIANKDGKYGVIGQDNNTILPFEYVNILNRKNTDILEAEKDEINTELYNKDMELKVSGIVSELNTEKGYINIRVDAEQKYYNFKLEEKPAKDIFVEKTLFLSKKDGKYGYTNKEGKVVVDYIYDDAKEQNSFGFMAVKKGTVWGSLNKEGNVVLEPSVNLDNNLVIDFVGKWHLGEDLNMNYYTK